MKLSAIIGFILTCAVALGTAHADRWDSRGWVKLGENTVNGRVDRDRIAVGRHEGRFARLTLRVEGGDLELLDMTVVFSNGQKFNPSVRHYFRENARSRVIDLPGDERAISSIEMTYKNVRGGGGRARVEVWGLKTESGRNDRRDHDRRDRDRDRGRR